MIHRELHISNNLLLALADHSEKDWVTLGSWRMWAQPEKQTEHSLWLWGVVPCCPVFILFFTISASYQTPPVRKRERQRETMGERKRRKGEDKGKERVGIAELYSVASCLLSC
jgi:hypothetical protein